MCYCQISWSLKAARLDIVMILLLWNLTGISAAKVPVKFQSDWKSLKPNQDFTRFCSKLSVRFVNRSPGLIYWYLIAPVAVKQPWRIWLNWSHTSTTNWWHNIILTNARILIIGPLGTNFNEFLIEIHAFSFTKIHLKMSSGKWRPYCLGLIANSMMMARRSLVSHCATKGTL